MNCPYCKKEAMNMGQAYPMRQFYCPNCQASSPAFKEGEESEVLFWSKPINASIILENGIVDAVDVPASVAITLYDTDVLSSDINGETPGGTSCHVVEL